ncbi:Ig-like domain-containing protein [Roseibacillus ishigakijimensis]|uniref:Uncharacterized protein n=1 Tax=Roseibacillus ishigakijimensis TaxID=454146 RepID=A0A934VJQ0_9BACT|nr:M12 family metallo-peptidase [Roseibacillus ishigakijimensis]MBK1832834.1 hypothetical protein [Roseibacillus ishigakijimensis]
MKSAAKLSLSLFSAVLSPALLAHPHHEGEAETAASVGPVAIGLLPGLGTSALTGKSRATLPPERVMEVLEFEIGVEIGSRAFHDTYGGDLKRARAAAESLIPNLDRRFLPAAGIKHRLGKVLIRTEAESDPLRDAVRKGDVGGLRAFRDYWNKNAGEVGKEHDLAVYHVHYAPSGIAYVNTVGSGNRYALSCGRGETSWADGTIAHEFGHSWNLHHNNKSGFFYEARPRDGRGARSAEGANYHVSIMHGGGNHNIGRLSTEEAYRVYETRQRKRQFGDPVAEPGEIAPFGAYDRARAEDGQAVTIDVIANDYDANNDVLDAQLLDEVSYHGGRIQLSSATGPGGRNEVIYTPPRNFVGEDFFHYLVVDATGKRDWGAVYVTVSGPVSVDLEETAYHYDFGTDSSPVPSDWTGITPGTKGDISWQTHPTKELRAVDEGARGGVNEINRDHVTSEGTTTLKHKIANGTWAITLNMGAGKGDFDRMVVRAEGRDLGSPLDSKAGEFPYLQGEVTVRDGELTLTFADLGGKSSRWAVTRLSLQKVAR